MNFLETAKQYEEQFLSDLKGLIDIPSLENLADTAPGAPFGHDVRKALDYMLELGRKEGFEVKDYDGYAGTITYGEGEESIGVLGHLDIVPLGEGWSKDPLGCEIHDGYVFGRGVVDDKGPTMAAFYAMKMLKDKDVKLDKKIILIVGTNEETGMRCMDYYAEHGEIPTCGFTPDADFPVIYGEKGHIGIVLESNEKTVIRHMKAGERPNIVIGKAQATLPKLNDEQIALFKYYLDVNHLKGQILHQGDEDIIEIEGKYFHAAMAYNGINAAVHILNYVGATFDDALAKQLAILLQDWKGSAFDIDIEGGYMGFLTMNVGIVEIQNGKTSVTLDIRYPNDTTGEDVASKIKATLAAQSLAIEVADVSDSKPLFVDPNSKLVKTLEASYREFTGDTFTPVKTIGGGTYARKFDNFVAFGSEFPIKEETPFFVGGPHEKDEGVKIENLMKACAIYAKALEELAK
ncbi:dipeptidase PepV [Breznakia sp. OttesenSCG-928-G09]|nr:dipeptidase PepV [Breznakia sp. OttesenSCG-928-G09]